MKSAIRLLATASCVAILALGGVGRGVAAAGSIFETVESHFVTAGVAVRARDARDTCQDVGRPPFGGQSCKVAAFQELGKLRDRSITGAWYRTSIDENAGWMRFVLYESRRADELVPVWTYFYECSAHHGNGLVGPGGIIGAKLVHSADGDFVEFQVTSAGTAGESQEYLKWNGDHWAALRTVSNDSLLRCVPPEFMFWHGYRVDMARHRGLRGTLKMGPDQTPGTIVYDFKVEGSALRVSKCRHLEGDSAMDEWK